MTSSPRYEKISPLGQGGMGSVWLVMDHERQEPVAQKRILTQDPKVLLLFKREFRSIASLLHPNIVKLYELGEDAEGLYFTMEPIDGWDLEDYFNSNVALDRSSSQESVPSNLPATQTNTLLQAPEDATQLDATWAATSLDEPTQLQHSEAASVSHKDDSFRALPHKTQSTLWKRVLPQLLDALTYLHNEGIVHRDLKPGNVMVTKSGTLKLLDFGILANLRRGPQVDMPHAGAGTPGYMAPEQIKGDSPTPASDLYALGALLFYLISGRPVFLDNNPLSLAMKHLMESPPSLGDVAPDTAPALVMACDSLLVKEPDQRPHIHELRALLQPFLNEPPQEKAAEAIYTPRASSFPLVGRESEQARFALKLTSLSPRTHWTVFLKSDAGVGRSALLSWILSQSTEHDMVVLQSQVRNQEKVPFNAIDGAMDQLALLFTPQSKSGPPEEIQQALQMASTLFPVLQPKRQKSIGQVTRYAAFQAIHSLLEYLVQTHKKVLWLLDDLHWADRDSLAFLHHLLERQPLGLGLIATYRRDSSFEEPWEQYPQVELVELSSLSNAAIQKILNHALSPHVTLPTETLTEAAMACNGQPFLAEVAGALFSKDSNKHNVLGASFLDDYTEHALHQARELLALLVVAGQQLSLQEAAGVLEQTKGSLNDQVDALVHQRILHHVGGNEESYIDLAHNTLRNALHKHLKADEQEELHHRCATWLEQQPHPPAERLVRHHLEARNPSAAIRWAAVAGEQAEAQRAYGLAADMHELQFRHAKTEDEEKEHLRNLARMLSKSGQNLEASVRWSAYRERVHGQAKQHALINESLSLISANQYDEGYKRFEEALTAAEPRAWKRWLSRWISVLRFLRGPRTLPSHQLVSPTDVSPETKEQATSDVLLGQVVLFYDPMFGIQLLQQARDRCVRSKLWEQVAFCDYILSFIVGWGNPSRQPSRLALRYNSSAEQIISQLSHKPDIIVEVSREMYKSLSAIREHDITMGVAHARRVHESLQTQGMTGTFLHTYTLSVGAYWLVLGQQLEESQAWLDTLRTLTHNTLDSATVILSKHADIWLSYYQNDTEQVIRLVAEINNLLPKTRKTVLHIIQKFYDTLPKQHNAAPGEIAQLLREAWREGKAIGLHRNFYVEQFAGMVMMAEARALRSGDKRAKAYRVRKLGALCERSVPTFPCWPWRARAYTADAQGKPEQAITHLRTALRKAQHYSLPIDEAIALYQLGLRLQGEEGASLCREAEHQLHTLHISAILLHEDPGFC